MIIIGSNPKLEDSHLIKMIPQWYNLSIPEKNQLINNNSNFSTRVFHNIEKKLTSKFKNTENINFFSIKKYICNEKDQCYLREGDNYFYIDKEHLSSYSYELFWKDLKETIERI